MKAVHNILKTAVIILFWLLVWEVAAYVIQQPLFLPKFTDVCKQFLLLFSEATSYVTALSTLVRILTGFLEGLLLGILLAVLSYRFPVLLSLLSPVITVIRSTPVASFIMLLWLIIGSGRLPTAIALLMVLPVIYSNVLAGLHALSPDLHEVCRLYRFPPLKSFKVYVYPSVMPYFSPGAITALGLSWKAGVAAEVLAHTKISIGNEIYFAKSYLEVEQLYAWSLVVILLSLILEYIIRRLLRNWTKGGKYVAQADPA